MSDEEIIRSTIGHPKIWRHVTDDSCQSIDAIDSVNIPGMTIVGAYSGETYLGLFMLHATSGVTYEVHTALLPIAWGEIAANAAKSLVCWVFQSTPCERLITSIPDGNDLARRLAMLVGMEKYGHNPKSMRRNGALIGQDLFGISKGDVCQ